MAKFKFPKPAKAGKVGHAESHAHKGQDLVALASKVSAHRKGAGAKTKIRVHGATGLRAQFGLPTVRKGSTR
jgi:hypothetical protein